MIVYRDDESFCNRCISNYKCFYLDTFTLIWQVIDEFNQHVHLVEIDIEEDPEIAEAAGIMGTPCVQFFKNKEMIRLVKLEGSKMACFAITIHISDSFLYITYCIHLRHSTNHNFHIYLNSFFAHGKWAP